MPGPGEYVADRTEGITRIEDLPKAKRVPRSRNYARRPCPHCDRSCYRHRYFNVDTSDLAPPGGHYTHRVIALAVRLVVEDGLPYRAASWHLWRDHRVFVPFSTIQNWVEAGGKKGTAARRRRIPRRRAG